MPNVLIVDYLPPGPDRTSRWDGITSELADHGVECVFHHISRGPDLFTNQGMAEDLAQAPQADVVILGTQAHEATRQTLATSWSCAGRSVVFLHEGRPPRWQPLVSTLARQSGQGEIITAAPHELRGLVLRRFGINGDEVTPSDQFVWGPTAVAPMYRSPHDAVPMYLWKQIVVRPANADVSRVSEHLADMQEKARASYVVFRLSTGCGLEGITDQLPKVGVLEAALRWLGDEEIAKYREPLEDALTARLHDATVAGQPNLDALRPAGGGADGFCWTPGETQLAFLAAWRGLGGKDDTRHTVDLARQWWTSSREGVYSDMLRDAQSPTQIAGLPRMFWEMLGQHLPDHAPDPFLVEGFQFTNLITWNMAARHRSAPEVVRLATERLPGRTWVRHEARDALSKFVVMSPPRSVQEGEAWDEVVRGIKHRSALLAIAEGVVQWPWLPPCGVTACEVYRARGGEFTSFIAADAAWRVLPQMDSAYDRTGELLQATGDEYNDLGHRTHKLSTMRGAEMNLGSFDPLVATEKNFFEQRIRADDRILPRLER